MKFENKEFSVSDEKIVEMYLEGLTMEKIAVEAGCSKSTVSRKLKEMRVKARRVGRPWKRFTQYDERRKVRSGPVAESKRLKSLNPEELEDAVKDYLSSVGGRAAVMTVRENVRGQWKDVSAAIARLEWEGTIQRRIDPRNRRRVYLELV